MSSTLTRGLVLKYPIDPTGVNPNNLITGEEHDLGSGLNRAIVPEYSAYYSESLVVTVADRVDPLVPYQHYIAVQLHADATAALNREVCMAVVIIDQNIVGKVSLQYQTVGGDFSVSVDALRQAIEDEDLDERTVSWGDVIARPSAFPPAPHLHDIGDLYGFEYVVEALEALRSAILIGDEAIHEEIRSWVRYEDSLLRARIDENQATLNAHIQDTTNPHQTTKAQVGLGSVENYGIASTEDMVAASSNTLYTTPLRVRDAINEHALKPLNAHIARNDNPHGVTKGQVGLGNVANYNVASKVDMETGTSPTLYTTPLLVKQALDFHIITPFNTFIARTDNPHNVNKAQVGLGSVQNYGVAAELDARAGTSNTLYMTPLRTAQAIATQALVPLNAHIDRKDNPHTVTKAQVGLSLVDNHDTATQVDALAGTASNKFMTPLRTMELVNKFAVEPLNSHISRTDNPHGVTKTQVGLGNLPNSITADRGSNTNGSLLTAAGMYGHVNSGDHDARYAPKNTAGVDCSVHWNGSGVYIWGGGTWRQVWPAQWV